MSSHLTKLLRDCIVHQAVGLSSGEVSDVYIDLRKLVLSNERHLIESLYSQICLVYNNHTSNSLTDLVVAGPVLGGALLSAQMAARFWIGGALAVRPSGSRYHGLRNRVEGPSLQTHKPIWLVDDVLTTGKSLHSTYEALLQERNLTVIGATVIVDRSSKNIDLPFPVYHLRKLSDLL